MLHRCVVVTSIVVVVLAMLTGCGSSSPGGGGTDEGATPTWAKSYGGPAREQATAAQARAGGGFVFAGTLDNRGAGSGRITGLSDRGHDGDFWVAALDDLGDIEWQRSYGRVPVLPPGAEGQTATYMDVAAALDLDDDGRRNGAWLLGKLSTFTRTSASAYGERSADALITRLDANDQVVWSRSYDSGPYPGFPYFFTGDEQETSEAVGGSVAIAPTADGGALAAVPAEATLLVEGRAEIARAVYVLKVAANGDVDWSILVRPEELTGITLAGDCTAPLVLDAGIVEIPGGAVVAFTTRQWNADCNETLNRMTVMRLDAGAVTGTIRWTRRYDNDEEVPYDLLAADDDGDGTLDGILVAGKQEPELQTGDPDSDGVLRKLDGDGDELWRRTFGRVMVSIVSTCPAAGGCRYGVQGHVDDEMFLLSLDPASGDVLAERRFGRESEWGSGQQFGKVARNGNVLQLWTAHERTAPIVLRTFEPSSLTLQSEVRMDRSVGLGSADVDGGRIGLVTSGDARVRRIFHRGADGSVVSAPVALGSDDVTLERAFSVIALPARDGPGDPGFVVAGEIEGPDSTGEPARSPWMLQLDATGNIQWQKRLEGLEYFRPGRNDDDEDPALLPADLLRATDDGGFVIGGHDVAGRGRVARLTAGGDLVWNTVGLTSGFLEVLRALREAPDGGYWVAGQLRVTDDFDPSGAWVIRLDPSGAIVWRNRYILFDHSASDLHVTGDDRALLVGRRGKHGSPAAARINPDGSVRWAKTYVWEHGADFLHNVRVAPGASGGWVLAATVRNDRRNTAAAGQFNLLLFEIAGDAAPDPGAVLWAQFYGALYDEVVNGVTPLADGGYIVSAQSDSMGDYTEAWMLRVGPDGRIAEGCNAALRRGGIIARPLSVDLAPHPLPTGPEATQPAGLTMVDTRFVAGQPRDVVVARQCSGVSSNAPGPNTAARALTVRQAGALTGVVTSQPSGITCGTAGGGECSAAFPGDTEVLLRVDLGSIEDFERWGAGCDSVIGEFSEVCVVRLGADTMLDVFFNPDAPPPPPPPPGFALDVVLNGDGTGVVSSAPGGIDCGADCSEIFAPDTVVTLTADAITGEFAGFTRCDQVMGNQCTAIMNAARGVTATFRLPQQTRTLTFNVVGNGRVETVDTRISCPGTCSAVYAFGAVVQVNAVANAGALLEDWAGDCNAFGALPAISLTMERDLVCTALFANR